MARRLPRADRVPQGADPLDLQLDHVARLQPPAVTELQDAARADSPRAEHVAGVELGVPGRLLDDRLPGVGHVAELAARALLAVHPRDPRPGRAVELVRRDDDRPEARREVLSLRR